MHAAAYAKHLLSTIDDQPKLCAPSAKGFNQKFSRYSLRLGQWIIAPVLLLYAELLNGQLHSLYINRV